MLRSDYLVANLPGQPDDPPTEMSTLETARPRYHFTPPAGWLNDPNGLVFHAGEWHLFYQAVPPGTQGKHWGHAVSRDLVHWEHLPVALAPDELGEIWSGSAVVDGENTSGFFDGIDGGGIVAIFTHSCVAPQAQSLAYSRDDGRTWTKHAGNPVLASGGKDFRDPKVFWHGPTGRWAMILATGDCVGIFVSGNLREWERTSEFGRGGLPEGAVFECPDLFALPGPDGKEHWMLTVSGLGGSLPEGICETRYWTGHFDGERFLADEGQPAGGTLTDHGPDDYAAVTWDNAPNNERIAIGWMSRWSYADHVPTAGWTGQMTVPRRLSLDRSGRLRQFPVESLQTLRGGASRWSNVRVASSAVELRADTGPAFELVAVIRLEGARECGFRLRMGSDGETETTVGYDSSTRALFVDRTRSGQVGFHPRFAARHDAGLRLAPPDTLRLHLFVDLHSVEVFAQDGEALLTALVFPPSDGQGLVFYAAGGAAVLERLEFYELGTA